MSRSTRIVRSAIQRSPKALGCTTTGLLPNTTGSTNLIRVHEVGTDS